MYDAQRKDHIAFSVRGQKVETTLKTLSIFPDSKLYHLAKYLLHHHPVQHERRATAPPTLQAPPPKPTTSTAVISATPTTEKKEGSEATHHDTATTEHKEGVPAPAEGDYVQDNYGVTLVHEHREIHNHGALASQDYSYETHSYALLGEPHAEGTPAPAGHTEAHAAPSTTTHKDCCPPPHHTEAKPAPKTLAELYPDGYPLDRDHGTFLKLLHYHDIVAGCGRVHYDAFVALEAKYWEVDYPHESKQGMYLAIITAQRSEGMLRGHFAKYIRMSDMCDLPFDWTPLETTLDYEFIGTVRKHLDEDWEHKWRLVGMAGDVIEDGDEVRGAVLLEHK